MTSRLRKVAGKIRRLLRKPRQKPLPRGLPSVHNGPHEWERVPHWLPADQLRGWQSLDVPSTQKARWAGFLQQVEGPEPLGVSHEASASRGREQQWMHNLVMTYGYVLGRAAHCRNTLSILDWGAGIGHFFVFTRALFPELHLDYTGYDFKGFCTIGETLLPEVRFVDTPEHALARHYQLVMAGSSLWYSERWKDTLISLADVCDEWLYINRMIFVRDSASFVVVQRPQEHGYDTEYQCWVLNRQSFLEAAESCGMRLEREFIFGAAPAIHGAPEAGTFRGFLFRRNSS